MADRPITDQESAKGGERSVLALGIVSACLLVLLLIVGFGGFNSGGKSGAPNTPQPNTESPATSGAQKP
jgi:hypothetical protein